MINTLLRPITPITTGTRPSEGQQLLIKAYVPPADVNQSCSVEPAEFQFQQQYQLSAQASCVGSVICNDTACSNQDSSTAHQSTTFCSNLGNLINLAPSQLPTTSATTQLSNLDTINNSGFTFNSDASPVAVTVASGSDVLQCTAVHYATIPACVFESISSSNQPPTNCTNQAIATTSAFITARGSRTATGTTSSTVKLAMPEQSQEVELLAAEGEVAGESVHLQLDAQDEKIMAATLKAFESGSLTPLIKEELRCTIQSRRLAAGKGELQVEFKRPVKRKEMTDEERKRAVKRRQQNREAAQRFRQRQKDTTDYLSGKIKRLEKASNSLISDLKKLRDERDELKKMLEDHLIVCPNHDHASLGVDLDVEKFLRELTTPSTSSTAQLSLTTPECPDTADSSASVFFSDVDDINDISHTGDTLGSLVAELNEGHPEDMPFSYCGSDVDSAGAPEVCYEEVVVDMDFTDSVSEYSDDQRLDSCSSVDTASNYDSVSSELTSLSESTTDLRHSLASAYSRVHMDSCSSEPFETSYIVADFLLPDDESP